MMGSMSRHGIVLLGFLVCVGAPAPARAAEPDWKAVEQALGKSGQLQPGDVFRIGMPRSDLSVTVKAAITGDFVLIDKEVNPVARMLRQHGIDVTALHNHGLQDSPRLFYMHFWAVDDAAQLARGLKAALDQTNSQK
jgi:hypothetical protein